MTTERAKPTTGDAYESISTAELIRYLRERASIRSDTDARLMLEAAARLSERRGNWQGIISCPTDDSEWSMLLPDGDIVVGRWSISQNRWQKRSIIEKTAVWTNLPEGVYPTHYARRQPLPEAPK